MNSVNHNKLLKSIPCVQISHVTKRFGEDLVLKEVNLDLNYGQVYGIVGNNGSGKTVLMKCICGFLPATTGTIHVSGTPIFRKALALSSRRQVFLHNIQE